MTAVNRTSWEHPDTSLLSNEAPVPSFLLEVFGDFWGRWVRDTALSHGCPVDYVALNLLVFAGALMGNARRVRSGSHKQSCVLWGLMVGPPSIGKSPAIDPFLDFVRQLELRIGMGLASSFWPDNNPAMGSQPPQFRIADTTAPATAEVASTAPKGLLLLKDELSGWMRKSRTSDLWLEAFNGGLHVENRKNKSPVKIDHMAVSVMGGIQPDMLRDVVTTTTDQGFASRFLYVFPEAVRPKRSNVKPSAKAFDALLRLADLELDDGKPVVVSLSRSAGARAERWSHDMFDRIAEHSGIAAGWLGKQRGVALRLAGILEHLWWVGSGAPDEPKEISTKAVADAQKLIDTYFYPMMIRSLGHAEKPLEDRRAQALILLLKRKSATHFKAREAKRGFLGTLGILAESEAFDEACELLEEAFLIKQVGIRIGGTPGRRSKDYEVNPVLFGGAR